MKKAILLATTVFLLPAIGGLNAPPAISQEAPAAAEQRTNDTTPTTAPTASPQVELLDAGTGLKQELRFRPAANTKQTAIITTNMEVATSIGGESASPIKLPASIMTMDVAVTQVDENGDIHSKFSVTKADIMDDPTVQPEVASAMRSAIQEMVGFSGTSITDNRGRIKSSSIEIPEGLNPISKQLLEQFSNSLSQLSSPVPEEAIGIGAKWRNSAAIDLSGINITQRTIYELVDLRDNVATLKASVEVQQVGDSQKITLPGMTSGASVTLKSMTSQGQGEIIMPLDKVMPTRSTMSLRSNTQMNLNLSEKGEETPLETDMSMQVTLESQAQK